MTDIDLPREAVEAAIRAHHNFVLGEDVPLTKRDVGIEFQAWHVALTAALSHIAPTLPSAEAVEAACRAVHPTRWEYPATAHPCGDCTTAVTAAGPIIAAEVRRAPDGCAWCCASNPPGVKPGSGHDICPAQRDRIARGEGS